MDFLFNTSLVTGKAGLCRFEQACRVPGVWGYQNLKTIGKGIWQGSQPYAPAPFTLKKKTLVLIYVRSLYRIEAQDVARGIGAISVMPKIIEQISLINVVCFLLGDSPASDLYMPTFRNTLSVPSSKAAWNQDHWSSFADFIVRLICKAHLAMSPFVEK